MASNPFSKEYPDFPKGEQIEAFYSALGKAIAAWQIVETELCMVFQRSISPKLPGALFASFHQLQTFKSKLDVTNAALEFVLADESELLEEWRRLRKKLDRKSSRRNEFAHFSVFSYYGEKNISDRVRLRPQLFDTRYIKGNAPQYRVEEILHIAARFGALAGELKRFEVKIRPAVKFLQSLGL